MKRAATKGGGLQIARWYGPLCEEDTRLIREAVDQAGLGAFVHATNAETIAIARAIPHCTTDDERWVLIAEAAYYATLSDWARAYARSKAS